MLSLRKLILIGLLLVASLFALSEKSYAQGPENAASKAVTWQDVQDHKAPESEYPSYESPDEPELSPKELEAIQEKLKKFNELDEALEKCDDYTTKLESERNSWKTLAELRKELIEEKDKELNALRSENESYRKSLGDANLLIRDLSSEVAKKQRTNISWLERLGYMSLLLLR